MDLIIKKFDETYITLEGEQSLLYEISDLFTFYAEGYRFNPKYKSKIWDGKIRLLRLTTKNKGKIYSGLLFDILKYCKNNNYTYEFDKTIFSCDNLQEKDITDFIETQNITAYGKKIEAYDHQIKGVLEALNKKRTIILSATSSGKSLQLYLIVKYLHEMGLRGILIVPNISLIHQMYNDFIDYSSAIEWNPDDYVHKIYEGQERKAKKPIVLSTYQSLNLIKEDSFFEQFDYVLWDEAHNCKAKILTSIMEKFINAQYKLGFTGSLDSIQSNIKTVTGLFGPVTKVITARELIDQNKATPLTIKCLLLQYDEETCKKNKKLKYNDEIKYLITNKKRNIFIKNLALSMKGNTIVLSNYVDKHGKVLYEMISNSKLKGDKKVFWIHGKVPGEDREKIRQILEKEDNCIIVATSSIMSTGISIRNLFNLILTTPGKSTIRLIQTCGRLLRLHDNKVKATLYDVVDDMRFKNHNNYSIEHYINRVEIYNNEQHDYKIIKVPFSAGT